jgi:hypothetical protein
MKIEKIGLSEKHGLKPRKSTHARIKNVDFVYAQSDGDTQSAEHIHR